MKSLWLVALIGVFAFETGVLIGFTPDALNNILKDFLPDLSNSIESTSIPLISLPSIGKGSLIVDLDLKNLQIPTFNIDPASSGLVFNSNRQIRFTLNNINAITNFDWELSKGNYFEKGTTLVSILKAKFEAVLTVQNSQKLEISISDVKFTIQDLDIQLSQTSSAKILNWLLETINNKITQVLENELIKILQSSLDSLFKKLSSVTRIPISQHSVISIQQSASPVIDEKHIHFLLEGVVLVIGKSYELNLPTPPVLQFTTTQSLQISISDYSINSALYAVFLSNAISFSTNSLGLSLTTGFLDSLLPGLAVVYGKTTPVDLVFYSETTPLIKFTEGSLVTHVNLTASFNLEENKSFLTLKFGFDIVSSVTYDNWVINGQISSIKTNHILVVSSDLTNPPDVEGIESLLNLTFQLGKSRISKLIFNNGISLPDIGKLFITNVNLKIQEGFILFEGSPKYPSLT